MAFWNFCHNTLGMHVFDFLTIVGLVIFGISLYLILTKQKEREDRIKQMEQEIDVRNQFTEMNKKVSDFTITGERQERI